MLIGVGVVLTLIIIIYLLKQKWHFRYVVISICAILLCLTSHLIATNQQNHYGMHVFVDSSGSMVYSPITKHPKILLYDDGSPTNRGCVYYFKQYSGQTTISKTAPRAALTKINYVEQPATLITKTGYWLYNSPASQFWFDFSHNENQIDHKSYYFSLNSSWIEMSVHEAKAQHLIDAKTSQQLKRAKATTY